MVASIGRSMVAPLQRSDGSGSSYKPGRHFRSADSSTELLIAARMLVARQCQPGSQSKLIQDFQIRCHAGSGSCCGEVAVWYQRSLRSGLPRRNATGWSTWRGLAAYPKMAPPRWPTATGAAVPTTPSRQSNLPGLFHPAGRASRILSIRVTPSRSAIASSANKRE